MIQVKKIEKSRVEIIGSISPEIFESFRKKALQNINEEISIDGFRKGKIPENILMSKVGEMTILEEMAELALREEYPKIIETKQIDAIGHPEIKITKIASSNPLEFKIITAVTPEIKLGDYNKISKEESKKTKLDVEVTEKEIDEAILNIRRSRVSHDDHDHTNIKQEEHQKLIDSSLPEFNEEFVQSLGNFKDVSDFKDKLKVIILEDKKEKEKDKKRISISDKLIETSSIDLPDILIESELKRSESQFIHDIEKMGVKLDDYLKHLNKTIEDLREDWKPHAEKKAKLQLILNKIAEIEKIIVDPKEIEEEVKNIIEKYKDANHEHATIYAETVLMNEKVFKFLEGSN